MPLKQSGHLPEIYVGLQEVLVIILSAHNSVSLLAVTGNKDLTHKTQKYLKAFIINELQVLIQLPEILQNSRNTKFF